MGYSLLIRRKSGLLFGVLPRFQRWRCGGRSSSVLVGLRLGKIQRDLLCRRNVFSAPQKPRFYAPKSSVPRGWHAFAVVVLAPQPEPGRSQLWGGDEHGMLERNPGVSKRLRVVNLSVTVFITLYSLEHNPPQKGCDDELCLLLHLHFLHGIRSSRSYLPLSGCFRGKKKNFSASQSVFEFNKRTVMPFLMYAASFKVAFLRIIVIISLPHFLSFQLFAKVFTKADSPVTAM